MTEPTSTHQLFQHDRVAEGYASARPYLHPQVFLRLATLIGPRAAFRRALDVGCGTGLSSVALRALASRVVGADVSVEMLRRAQPRDGVAYVAATAEQLPFAARSVDLVVACGAMDWIDRASFLPRAAELIDRGGWLVSLDFGDAGRSPESPALEAWHRGPFQRAYPTPPARDPFITEDEATRCGFAAPTRVDFTLGPRFTAEAYARFLMTESSVVAAVEFGTQTASAVHAWLDDQLAPLFGTRDLEVTFSGYIQAMMRV